MRVVFIGPPGVGKGTQAGRLTEHLGMVHLSTGDMLRAAREANSPLGMQAAQYMDAGKLVPDDVVIELVVQRLAELGDTTGFLFDGFPRNTAQAGRLDEVLAERSTPLDWVVLFEVGEVQLFDRLSKRGRNDDLPETIYERLKEYERQTAPLVLYYRRRGILRAVDGVGTPDEVFERIKRAVNAD